MARVRIDCMEGLQQQSRMIEYVNGKPIGPARPRWIPTVDIRLWTAEKMLRAWTWDEPSAVWHLLVGAVDR